MSTLFDFFMDNMYMKYIHGDNIQQGPGVNLNLYNVLQMVGNYSKSKHL